MSNSLRVSERFAARAVRRRVVSVAYIGLVTAYLAWRLTIINPNSLVLSWAYFTAEVIGFILGLTVIFSSWSYRHRTPPKVADGLKVDVFVPVYKEPLEMVQRTLIAARDISYPHTTYVLDDGRRPELRALAARLGIIYLSRPLNVNAKAGNLNFGLAHSTGDFVAVFDADHIAQPHALHVMLGFFEDANVAMVQAPQDYYNTDAFQYMNARRTGELWHDQSFFYNIAQPCRDAFDAASCAGTSAVYRRTALAAIGGVPEETVTEDLHTSLKLHKAGQQVAYINEPVAYGAAAVDLGEYYKTRHRWAHGNLHALRIENAAFTSKLSWRQKLSYLTLGLIYLEGWQQLLLFAIPMIALLFGLPPFEITVFNVLVVLTFPILTHLMLQEIGCGFSRYWANEIFAMARFPVHIAAAWALVRGPMTWRSSSKAMKGVVEWRLLSPQLAVAVGGVMALGIGIWRLAQEGFTAGPLASAVEILSAKALSATGVVAGAVTEVAHQQIGWHEVMKEGYTLDLVVVAGFWVLLNAARAIAVTGKALKAARNSHEQFRFNVPLVATLQCQGQSLIARVERTSSADVEFDVDSNAGLAAGDVVSGLLYLPNGAVSVALECKKRLRLQGGLERFEASYIWASDKDRARLEAALFNVDWYRQLRGRAAYFLTPIDVLSNAVAWVSRLGRGGTPSTVWQPIMLHSDKLAGVQFALFQSSNGDASEMAAFQPLTSGAIVACDSPCGETVTARYFLIQEEISGGSEYSVQMDPLRVYRYKIQMLREADAREAVLQEPVLVSA